MLKRYGGPCGSVIFNVDTLFGLRLPGDSVDEKRWNMKKGKRRGPDRATRRLDQRTWVLQRMCGDIPVQPVRTKSGPGRHGDANNNKQRAITTGTIWSGSVMRPLRNSHDAATGGREATDAMWCVANVVDHVE